VVYEAQAPDNLQGKGSTVALASEDIWESHAVSLFDS
jgi:hypothetical protein